MKPTRFETAIAIIDQKNAEDPNPYEVSGLTYSKELLYSQRMTRKLLQFEPNASKALQIAARAQHICRWKIARKEYPMDRVGYLKWREELKKMHANITGEILVQVGYDDQFVDRVQKIILKKLIKKNEESQTLEDTICLVFLDYYFDEFAAKHTDEKIIDILKKTWVKMSDKGHSVALLLPFSEKKFSIGKTSYFIITVIKNDKKGNSLDQRTFNKLSRLYIIALSTIALSVIISQVLVRNHLNKQQSDSTVINIAGRQRMLSQKLTKEIVSLSVYLDEKNRVTLKEDIKNTLYLWELSHNSLQKGNDSLGLPKQNSIQIENKFTAINPVFETIQKASKSVILKLEKKPLISIDNLASDIKIVTSNEGAFLLMMDAIVNQYEVEADEKVAWLRTLEFSLMVLTLLILLGEFLFIFWPTAKSVKSTLTQLLSAEKEAKKMAFNADELSISKEKSIRELRALSQAIDETLLFARISPNGDLIHMGNKFSRLFKFSKFKKEIFFWNVLSSNENEQLLIEDLINKHKKTGWQGELKATIKGGEDVWLEMSIVPYRPTEDKSELLIIASEITSRKEGQIEIERLIKESFEEKMSQQKIISSKIIENQEKEQNRIAKDVHDGIGQMLTGLKYNLESININDVEKTASKIEHLKELTTNIIKGVRTATFNLTPPELSDHGVVPAISKLTKELGKLTGKEILFYNKTDFDERLDSLIEINIYRIVQEAINNAIKYAESSHILVSLSHSKNILSIVVDDDGKGFEPSKVKKVKNGDGGMGMTFMRERIKYVEGRLFLNSEVGKGTRVTLNIPI